MHPTGSFIIILLKQLVWNFHGMIQSMSSGTIHHTLTMGWTIRTKHTRLHNLHHIPCLSLPRVGMPKDRDNNHFGWRKFVIFFGKTFLFDDNTNFKHSVAGLMVEETRWVVGTCGHDRSKELLHYGGLCDLVGQAKE
jgi:hypothetical protein